MTIKSEIRKTTVKEILSNTMSGDFYSEKKSLTDSIKKRFEETTDFKELSKRLEECVYDPKKSKATNSTITKLNKIIEELEGQVSDEKIEKIVNAQEIKLRPTANTPQKKISQISAELKSRVTKLNKEHDLLVKQKGEHSELMEKKTKSKAEFDKSEKERFDTWVKDLMEREKDNIGAKGRKYTDKYECLEAALSDVPESDRELFEMCIKKGKLTSKCVKIAKGDEIVVNVILEPALEAYVNGSISAFTGRLHESFASDPENVDKSITPYDLAQVDLSACNMEMLFDSKPLRDMKSQLKHHTDESVSSEAFNRLVKLSETPEGESIRKNVQKFCKKDMIGTPTEEFVSAVTGLLVNICRCVGQMIKCILDTRKCITLNASMFHVILEPMFIVKEVDYTETRKRIDELWPKHGKKSEE